MTTTVELPLLSFDHGLGEFSGALFLTEADREHRDRAAVKSLDGKGHLVVGTLRREDIEQRQIVVGRRRREHRVLAHRRMIGKRSVIAP